jgi:hypothetical protein
MRWRARLVLRWLWSVAGKIAGVGVMSPAAFGGTVELEAPVVNSVEVGRDVDLEELFAPCAALSDLPTL